VPPFKAKKLSGWGFKNTSLGLEVRSRINADIALFILVNIPTIGFNYSNYARKVWMNFCKLTVVGARIIRRINPL
jgi:hypothetical protein